MTRTPLRAFPRFSLGGCFAGALLAGLAGCGTFDYTPDFADNELFYADVPFRTKAPGDLKLFVAPVADRRTAASLPQGENGFPIQYGGDDFWRRPVAEMFADVLQRQLQESDLFVELVDQADADTVVLRPELVAFTVGAQEGVSGSMTFAEVGVRVQIDGPVAQDGARPLWHDQVYGNRQRSEYQVKPVSPYRLIGRAMQLTMSKALTALDGSNIARSAVPVTVMVPGMENEGDAGVPAAPAAEASVVRR